MKCLNDFKELNEKMVQETQELVKIKEEVTIEEHNIEFVPVNNYFEDVNPTNVIF